jgi:hypothetical protein
LAKMKRAPMNECVLALLTWPVGPCGCGDAGVHGTAGAAQGMATMRGFAGGGGNLVTVVSSVTP